MKTPIDTAIDIARCERETLRWVLTSALWHARPYGTTERVLLLAAQDAGMRATFAEVRAELDWLVKHGIAEVERRAKPMWEAQLTAHGMDICEYRADAPSGMARPERW